MARLAIKRKYARLNTVADIELWRKDRLVSSRRDINRAAQLRKAKLAAGLTCAEIAEQLDRHPSTVSWWLTGRTILTDERMKQFLRAVSRAAR